MKKPKKGIKKIEQKLISLLTEKVKDKDYQMPSVSYNNSSFSIKKLKIGYSGSSILNLPQYNIQG